VRRGHHDCHGLSPHHRPWSDNHPIRRSRP
jgi:hypothetical protein